jgi:hypothetical protein
MSDALTVPVTELSMIGVSNPGVPDKEMVVLRPSETIVLPNFAVAVGVYDASAGGARPIYDNVYWFPEIVISPPSWIFIYTGKGSPTENIVENGQRVLSLFWQRSHTIFGSPGLVPVLLRLGAVTVGRRM